MEPTEKPRELGPEEVVKLAEKFLRKHPYYSRILGREDALAYAIQGYYVSQARYRPEKGARSTYAFLWMRSACFQAVDRAKRFPRQDPVTYGEIRLYTATELQEDGGGLPEYAASLEAGELVERLLAGLVAKERELATRYWLGDETAESIAASWGVSRQAVEQRLLRIKEKLRARLQRSHAATESAAG